MLGELPLHTAAQNNQYEVVEGLCSSRALVEAAAGSSGWNALHIACCEDHRDVAYKLVVHKTLTQENQKLVDLPTSDGFSPLQIAVFAGHHDMVDFLKAADAAFPKEAAGLPFLEDEHDLSPSQRNSESPNQLDLLRSFIEHSPGEDAPVEE